jgi:hypothetical protein
MGGDPLQKVSCFAQRLPVTRVFGTPLGQYPKAPCSIVKLKLDQSGQMLWSTVIHDAIGAQPFGTDAFLLRLSNFALRCGSNKSLYQSL